MDAKVSNIRNFAIIAHIDHGKSTLADRLLEVTGTISRKETAERVLDTNPIERERGITIKLAPARMKYHLPDNLKQNFHFDFCTLNLIDTPGHVDFSYEVSRSLAACEGVILLVDATQGVQAQTLAYMSLVKEKKLAVIPVINKIDSPLADVNATRSQLIDIFEFSADEIIEISALKGINIKTLMRAILYRIPPPRCSDTSSLKALVFSSIFDTHLGVIVFVRIFQGKIDMKTTTQPMLMFMANGKTFNPLEIGYFSPHRTSADKLCCGEVGYIATGLKDAHLAQVGDTITFNPAYNPTGAAKKPLPGYKKMKPMVFQRIYPIDSNQFSALREALEKLHLADSAFSFRPASSAALGKGFHCGFLGLLHAEVVQERLEREFGLDVIMTTPTVEYRVKTKNGEEKVVNDPSELPDKSQIEAIKEPIMMVTIYSPKQYIGAIIRLAEQKRGQLQDMIYIGDQVKFVYQLPLSELITDFFDKLKSLSQGFASLDYEFYSYQPVNLVKIDILVNRQKIDALSSLVLKEKAYSRGKKIVEKLKEILPRQQFAVPIQAAINGKIIARSTISAFRKDVTAKLYGGDRTRKDKLLKKQKEGKKRMKAVGRVKIPQEAFIAVLKS